MSKFKGIHGIYTCGDWQQSTFIPDLEEHNVAAVLCISKNKKPNVTLEMYTRSNIQHYSLSIENLDDEKLEAVSLRIAKIIDWFVSKDQKILIHTNEECAVAYAIIYYMIWKHYHDASGALKPTEKKLDISIATRTINELKHHHIETYIIPDLVQKLYKFEDKYRGV